VEQKIINPNHKRQKKEAIYEINPFAKDFTTATTTIIFFLF